MLGGLDVGGIQDRLGEKPVGLFRGVGHGRGKA
jgi:hypothetical protein